MHLLGIDFADGQVETCITGLMPATCKDCFTAYNIASGVKAFLDNCSTDIYRDTIHLGAINSRQDWMDVPKLSLNVCCSTEAAPDNSSVLLWLTQSVGG